MKTFSIFFKISAVLWVIWGLVHMFAGFIIDQAILSGDISAAVAAVADAVAPADLVADYPAASGAIIGQHGFNLLWIGLVTTVCAYFIWGGNKNAIFLAAICGGLADLGYFLFLDLGGFVNFVPGTVMTLISSSAIILSFVALYQTNKQREAALSEQSVG